MYLKGIHVSTVHFSETVVASISEVPDLLRELRQGRPVAEVLDPVITVL